MTRQTPLPSQPPPDAGNPPPPTARDAPAAHDQLFKDLLRAFFEEFMTLFFPDVAARLNFSTVTFVDKELFTDLPIGKRREPDLVAQVNTTEGEPEIVMVHMEVESQRRGECPERMYEYYALLRLRFRRPVFPLAIFLSPGAGGLVREQYEERLFDSVLLLFYYSCVGLPDLSADDYQELANPLAPALSALMKPSHLGRALQKALILWRTMRSGVDEARKSLLVNVIETYLPLKDEEAEEFARITGQGEMEEVTEMLTIYEQRGIEKGRAEAREMLTIYEQRGIEKGIEKGLQQGVERGVLRGKRDLLLRFISRRFGPLPEAVTTSLEAVDSEAELDRLSDLVMTAGSLAEMGLGS